MTDPDGRHWKRTDLTGAGIRHGATGNVWRGIDVTAKRRHWAYAPDELERLDAAGRVHSQAKVGGMPRLRAVRRGHAGSAPSDVWTDIRPIHNLAVERVGYPTQKPLSLLERIITASTDPGDLVLDPFCGCGTALIAAESLGRRWVGIDLTYLAIGVMNERLKQNFQIHNVEVIGQPTELAGARQLAEASPSGRYQFPWWALGLVGAESEDGLKRKGADRGIDGRITFSTEGGAIGSVLVSVKSGHVSSSQVRDLVGTVEREYAAIGIFLTLSEPTRAMRREAATAGQYRLRDRDYPKIQILSIREILEEHRKPLLPPLVLTTDEQTGRTRGRAGQQLRSMTCSSNANSRLGPSGPLDQSLELGPEILPVVVPPGVLVQVALRYFAETAW